MYALFKIEKKMKIKQKTFVLLLIKRRYFLWNTFYFPKTSNEFGQGGTLSVKIQGGWLDSLGSRILVRKIYFGVFKSTDLNDS